MAVKHCDKCGQEIRSRRSVEISTRFHGHVGWIKKELYRAGVDKTYDEIYLRALLTACSIPDDMLDPGAAPYPYIIVDGVLHPKRTSNRTNREMMTACKGVELLAAEYMLGQLPEKEIDNETDEVSR